MNETDDIEERSGRLTLTFDWVSADKPRTNQIRLAVLPMNELSSALSALTCSTRPESSNARWDVSLGLCCRYDSLVSNKTWVGRVRISWEAAQREQGI